MSSTKTYCKETCLFHLPRHLAHANVEGEFIKVFIALGYNDKMFVLFH